MPRSLRTAASALIAASLLAAVVGCAPAASAPATSTSASATASGYPLTMENCGFPVTVTAAPTRVLTIKSTSTELLLALGLGDDIIGTAFQDGPVPDEWAAAAAKIPVISDKVPGQEAVLNLAPDFIYAGWESNLGSEGAGDRATLAGLGVGTYVSPAACKGAFMPAKLTFDELFDEFRDVGAIFNVEDRASALVKEQKATLASVTPDDRGLTALWYSSGSTTPYVGAGLGNPQMIMDAVGLTNIAADVDDTWTPLGWEAIVNADPDVIVLIDASWSTAASKIAMLESNPVASQLSAVKNHRYLTLPFPAGEAGVRSVPAVVDLHDQLEKLEG